MEPDMLFHIYVYHCFRKIAQWCGADIFVINYKRSARTYIFMWSLYILLLSCLWTIYSHPPDDKIICIAALCFDCQGIVKIHSITRKARELKDICDFSLKIYRANTQSSENKVLLKKSVELTVFIFKSGLALLITAAFLTCIRPCVSYFLTGQLEPILPTSLPGVDEREIAGFICLAVFHVYIMCMFVLGTAGTDLALMTLVIHFYTMSQIFRNAVTEFNSLVSKNKGNGNTGDIRASLNNLTLMHIDFMKYSRNMKLIYNEMCLIQITMANAIMIVLVYVILMLDWFPAYFLMATAFFQVFEYSLLGTIVEIANDNVYSTICNISITELLITDQKKVILMTLLAQHPHNLTIGGFNSLNVETFVFSMKNTYSVAMLLVNTQM